MCKKKKAEWEALVFLPVCGPFLLVMQPGSPQPPVGGAKGLERQALPPGNQAWGRLECSLQEGPGPGSHSLLVLPWDIKDSPSPGGRSLVVTGSGLAWPE